jgi:tetratricopeptide (TPR) repeat protein
MIGNVQPGSPDMAMLAPSRDLSTIFQYISRLHADRSYDKAAELLKILMDVSGSLSKDRPDADGNLRQIYQLMVQNCIAVGEVFKACLLCKEGLQSLRSSDELKLGLGDCLTRLRRFEEAERVLHQVNENGTSLESHVLGKNTSLGELYLRWDELERSRLHFEKALRIQEICIPAHVGLIELDIMETKFTRGRESLECAVETFGPEPELMLTAANMAMIASNFKEADEIAADLKGKLLGDDQFEYFLFQMDFLKGDHESLKVVPYPMTGSTLETEAARIWLKQFREEPYQQDPARIPESVWREELLALDRAWEAINNQTHQPILS